jgi:hypothetical protein
MNAFRLLGRVIGSRKALGFLMKAGWMASFMQFLVFSVDPNSQRQLVLECIPGQDLCNIEEGIEHYFSQCDVRLLPRSQC